MVLMSKLSASANITSTPPCDHWVYIYGIIPAVDGIALETKGLDDNCEEVYTVVHGEVAAVVSQTTQQNYRRMDRREAVQYLLSHQRVVEDMLDQVATLPMEFGTVVPDEARVHRLLDQGNELFRSTLDTLAGRMQMEVVVLWNTQEVFRQIAGEERIVQLKAQIEGRSPTETVNDRITIGQMVQRSLERRRKALQDALMLPFRGVALDVVSHALMDDSMVLNLALLLDEPRRKELDHMLEALDKQFDGRLTFRCVGPLPAYSFATIQVRVPSSDEVDAARQQLRLGQTCRQADIRNAYHRLAAELHPDHNPNDPEAEAGMSDLTKAYDLLTAYARSQMLESGEQGSETVITFDREAVENTLLISVYRPNMQT